MEKALIVSASAAGAAHIQAWLGDGYACEVAPNQAAATALLSRQGYGLLVVNAPLPDGDGEALCHRGGVDTLLFVPQARYAQTAIRMEPLGVLTLAKPVSAMLVAQALSLLRASRARVSKLEAKLSEVRIVDRAKWALIQMLKMSEAQAHRYIEKQAMDLRISRGEVAENIIKTYEN